MSELGFEELLDPLVFDYVNVLASHPLRHLGVSAASGRVEPCSRCVVTRSPPTGIHGVPRLLPWLHRAAWHTSSEMVS